MKNTHTNMSHLVTLVLALLLLVSSNSVMSQNARAAVPCNVVDNELSPCLPYLVGQYSSPSPPCCTGTKYVWDHYGKTKSKRQGVCDCLVSLLPLLGQIKASLISTLPQRCGLKFYLPPITPNFNCTMVN